MTVEIRVLQLRDAEACETIILGLPYHFGQAVGRAQAAAALRSQDGLVAVEDGEVVGFCTSVPRFAASAEITWMAVAAPRRREGIGHVLIDVLAARLVLDGRRILAVLTVSPNDPGEEPDDGYRSTRRFYEQMGFVLVRDLPGEWEGGDTAVLLAKILGPGTPG
ncbi:MAG: GNAT family N-acetyltransferase [Actinomycetota bacterium]